RFGILGVRALLHCMSPLCDGARPGTLCVDIIVTHAFARAHRHGIFELSIRPGERARSGRVATLDRSGRVGSFLRFACYEGGTTWSGRRRSEVLRRIWPTLSAPSLDVRVRQD